MRCARGNRFVLQRANSTFYALIFFCGFADVAARGLNFKAVEYVINFDLPSRDPRGPQDEVIFKFKLQKHKSTHKSYFATSEQPIFNLFHFSISIELAVPVELAILAIQFLTLIRPVTLIRKMLHIS
jgi:hypothetical protein